MSKWTDKEKKRLRKLWEKSGKDRRKFKELCLADPFLSKRGAEDQDCWNTCDCRAKALGFYKEKNTPASIMAMEKLEKENPEKVAAIIKDLADPKILWADIQERYEY